MEIANFLTYKIEHMEYNSLNEADLKEHLVGAEPNSDFAINEEVKIGFGSSENEIVQIISKFEVVDFKHSTEYKIQIISMFKINSEGQSKEEISKFVHKEGNKQIKLIVREVVKNLSVMSNQPVINFLPVEF